MKYICIRWWYQGCFRLLRHKSKFSEMHFYLRLFLICVIRVCVFTHQFHILLNFMAQREKKLISMHNLEVIRSTCEIILNFMWNEVILSLTIRTSHLRDLNVSVYVKDNCFLYFVSFLLRYLVFLKCVSKQTFRMIHTSFYLV